MLSRLCIWAEALAMTSPWTNVYGMARTMLALKTVLAGHDPVDTLIFDEIDANVGGRLGDVIGEGTDVIPGLFDL